MAAPPKSGGSGARQNHARSSSWKFSRRIEERQVRLASGEWSPRGFRRDTLADCFLSWVCKHPLELRGYLDEFNARQVRSRRLRNFLAGDRSAQYFPQQRFQSRVVTRLEIFLPLWHLRNL